MNRIISNQYWNLQRFGFTPKTIGKRFQKNGPLVFCTCIPKSGTHLLERILCQHPILYRKLLPTINNYNIRKYGNLEALIKSMKPCQILMSHVKHSEINRQVLEKINLKTIFLFRDPRDILVSRAFFILKRKKHYLHYKLQNLKNWSDEYCITRE